MSEEGLEYDAIIQDGPKKVRTYSLLYYGLADGSFFHDTGNTI
jgi:hypothetical protein